MRTRRGRVAALMFLGLVAAGWVGCGRPALMVGDAVVRPDGTAVLTAYLMRMSVAGIHGPVPDESIRFYLDDQPVGEAVTGKRGLASVVCAVREAGMRRITAQASLGDEGVAGRGELFRWKPDRTVVIVDIDGTICRTDYEDVVFDGEDDESKPVPMSRRVLMALAEDCNIGYLTVRPQFLLDKTRQWLAAKGYPRGPVFVAPSARKVLERRRYKTEALRRLRHDWPNVLIGIGNTDSDAYAYGANEMLTVIVGREPDDDFGRHAFVFGDWEAAGGFWAANRALFASPNRLARVIREGGPVRIPLGRFVPRGD